MRKYVSYLRTHTNMFVKAWGNLGDVLPRPSRTDAGLKMVRATEGVEVSADNKPSFLVPWGNVVIAELYEDDNTA